MDNITFDLEIQGQKKNKGELIDLITEERIPKLKLKDFEHPIKTGEMGGGTTDVLNVILNASAVSVALRGLFLCIKTYLELHPKDKVILKKGPDTTIEFNPDNVKDVDKLISEFITKM